MSAYLTTGCLVPEGWWNMLSEYWPTNFNVCFMQQFINKKTENLKSLVLACVVLHNLLKIRYPNVPANADQEDHKPCPIVPGVWREEGRLVNTGGHAGRNVHVDHNPGKQQRNYLEQYFMSEAGSVTWQEQMIYM